MLPISIHCVQMEIDGRMGTAMTFHDQTAVVQAETERRSLEVQRARLAAVHASRKHSARGYGQLWPTGAEPGVPSRRYALFLRRRRPERRLARGRYPWQPTHPETHRAGSPVQLDGVVPAAIEVGEHAHVVEHDELVLGQHLQARLRQEPRHRFDRAGGDIVDRQEAAFAGAGSAAPTVGA